MFYRDWILFIFINFKVEIFYGNMQIECSSVQWDFKVIFYTVRD